MLSSFNRGVGGLKREVHAICLKSTSECPNFVHVAGLVLMLAQLSWKNTPLP